MISSAERILFTVRGSSVVVLFTTSPSKVADGLRLGAHEVVVSTDAAAMAKYHGCTDENDDDCLAILGLSGLASDDLRRTTQTQQSN